MLVHDSSDYLLEVNVFKGSHVLLISIDLVGMNVIFAISYFILMFLSPTQTKERDKLNDSSLMCGKLYYTRFNVREDNCKETLPPCGGNWILS